jgi:hypothetical protein
MAKSYIFAISFKDMVKGSRIRKLLASAEALDNKKTANSEFFVGVLNYLEALEDKANCRAPA